MTPVLKRVEELEALDGAGKLLDALASRALSNSVVTDILKGRWLGHAAHPMLTDVTIGAWTSALLLDLLGGDRAHEASDTLVGIGALSAVPTALTGLADWSQTEDGPRRIGILHASTNSTALLLYASSYVARKTGRRDLGRSLSAAGAGVMAAGAYLGGHLSFAKGVGVSDEGAPRSGAGDGGASVGSGAHGDGSRRVRRPSRTGAMTGDA